MVSPIVAVLGAIVLLIWAVTEWVAWRFGFHPNLGVPLLPAGATTQMTGLSVAALAGGLGVAGIWEHGLRRFAGRLASLAAIALAAAFLPLYPPWSVFTWALRFGELGFAKPVFSTAWHAIAIPAHFLFVVAMVVAWRRARKNARLTDSHESAHWANDPIRGDRAALAEARERHCCQQDNGSSRTRRADPNTPLQLAGRSGVPNGTRTLATLIRKPSDAPQVSGIARPAWRTEADRFA